MKVELTEPRKIKGVEREAGDEVVVTKDLGERLIEEGLANRVVEMPENRVREIPEGRKFSNHKRFTSGVGFF